MDKVIDLAKEEVVLVPKGDIYVTVYDCVYKDLFIPKGTPTDGVSAKINLLYLFIRKYDPRVMTAVVIHDFLCELELYEEADRYFEERLPEITQKWWMVKAVKRYHDAKGWIK